MEVCDANPYLFVRLEPGEEIIASLKNISHQMNVRVGVITSGVGMLSAVEFGFFCTAQDDYEKTRIDEILDLSSIAGNVTWLGEDPIPHIHMTMNTRKYTTYSGHIIQAWCHITMEIFIRRLDNADYLRRLKIDGLPATRITRS